MPADDLLDTNEAAKLRHVSPRALRDWIKRGWLKPVKSTGRAHIFRRADVMAVKPVPAGRPKKG